MSQDGPSSAESALAFDLSFAAELSPKTSTARRFTSVALTWLLSFRGAVAEEACLVESTRAGSLTRAGVLVDSPDAAGTGEIVGAGACAHAANATVMDVSRIFFTTLLRAPTGEQSGACSRNENAAPGVSGGQPAPRSTDSS
jgi:hypothetical protein